MSETLAAANLKPPPSAPGMRIGLFGGSFNPPHKGHLLVARQVLKRLQLDQVWFLVTPGNPLKTHGDLADLAKRVAAVKKLAAEPRLTVTAFEAARGFTYSFETVSWLARSLPGRHFVWIMGSDNLASFHKWLKWKEISELMPMAVYERPGSALSAPKAPAAGALARFRIDEADAPGLWRMQPPAWVYLHGITSELSSTALRKVHTDMS